MKLNNRGWGLQVMMIFVLILMICLVIVSALINNKLKGLTDNTSYNYTIIENKVNEAAKKYIEQKQIILDNGDTYTITVSKMQKEGLLDVIKDDSVKCTGYSVVEKSNNNLNYKAYIKCGSNYKTKNYSSILDI